MKCNQLLSKLQQNGWIIISQRGSHIKMQHPDKIDIIIFPNHGAKELSKGIEKKIRKIAGI